MASNGACLFCQIARSVTPTKLLHDDGKVVAFEDINPSALSSKVVVFLWIPSICFVEHISTVKDLQKRAEDYLLVSHMLEVGKDLLQKNSPEAVKRRFGFHHPPFNSVDHLHLHCLALPYIPRWRHLKYLSWRPYGFVEVEKLLEKIKPSTPI